MALAIERIVAPRRRLVARRFLALVAVPAGLFALALCGGLSDGTWVLGIGYAVLASAFLAQYLLTEDNGKKTRGSAILYTWPRTEAGGLELRRDALVNLAIILSAGVAISYLLPGR
jgi:hypothetical protein